MIAPDAQGPHGPYAPPRPRPTARPRVARPHGKLARVPGWGWLEWFILSQTLIPALLFVPALSPLRTATRVSAFGLAAVAWVALAWPGRRPPAADAFPARPWLLFCSGWQGLSILHPNSYSLLTATAQAAMYITILSPVFWAPLALTSSRQIGRVMALLFLCNALSATLGIAQIYRPETFNPPVIPAMNNQFHGEDLMYTTGDGRKVLRPCGLTDTPGGACSAGVAAALLGLCWALRPIAAWKRLASLALAFCGVAVIYFTHVRTSLVMVVICLVALTGLFVLQQRYRQALILIASGAALVAGALAWTAAKVGSAVFERFTTLFQESPASLYFKSRGIYLQEAFEKVLPSYPLGYGMGWWGMVNAHFGDPGRPSPVWVEVMWPAWIFDGGLPLLVGYVGALALALADSIRIARTCPNRDLAFWAAVIVAFNLSILATCFSYVPFLSGIGVQFWLLAAALHAADARVRATRKVTGR